MRTLLCLAALAVSSMAATASADPGPAGAPIAGDCVVGEHQGFDDATAVTATRLVCDELAKKGARIGAFRTDPTDGPRIVVELGALGSVVILSARQYDETGVQSRTASLRLAGIEEVAQAAPRIAEAWVNNRPEAATAQVDNLVGEETRSYSASKRSAELLGGAGLMAIAVPGSGLYGVPGLILRMDFEAPRFAAGGSAFFGGLARGDQSAGFFGATVDGKYFFSSGDISPYLSAGLMYGVIGMGDGDQFGGTTQGVGLATSAGVEFRRLYRSRLALELRAHVPFFEIEDANGNADDTYTVPVGIAVIYESRI